MPGPLFNIAAYCGAVIAINAKVFPLIGIMICWVGLVLAHFGCSLRLLLYLSCAELQAQEQLLPPGAGWAVRSRHHADLW